MQAAGPGAQGQGEDQDHLSELQNLLYQKDLTGKGALFPGYFWEGMEILSIGSWEKRVCDIYIE